MKLRYNWIELKDEYCRSRHLTVADFFRDKHIPNNSRNRRSAVGWKQSKIEYQRKVIIKTQEKTAETESEIRLRQQQVALSLQSKGVEKMRDLSVKSIDDARKLITDGLIQEREAIGINDHRLSSTQINITTPTTELDQMVKGMSYEDVLGLIAEVKREKSRRSELSIRQLQ